MSLSVPKSPRDKVSIMKLVYCAVCTSLLFTVRAQAEADRFLVKDGDPHAEIILAEKAPRSTRLAAQELQRALEKMSGAKLPIVHKPTGRFAVRLFVGQSEFTDQIGIRPDHLKDGAYRIVAGDDWLVLIGTDTDFVPIAPWPHNYAEIRSGKMQTAWNKITGAHWNFPHSQLHKHYTGSTSLFGTADEQQVDREGRVNVWTFDERGSFNAVCGFLRRLGMRWYMPGEIGEVVPKRKTIPLFLFASGNDPAASEPPLLGNKREQPSTAGADFRFDQTVTPDFPLRILNFRFGIYGREAAMWAMRLGTRQPYGRQAAHGLAMMTHNEYTLSHHPQWFALYGGRRHNRPGQRLNQLCYSNEELFREAVRFARVQFDHYDMDAVSIMPPDGYTAICQCPLCQGKASPARGTRGALSDYVWDFVNRVAKEVKKTHPDRLISCCAYGIYTLPPTKIERLESNVQVIIVGGRRPLADRPQEREQLRQLRAGWARLTDRPVEIFENYPFTGRGFYLPAFLPRLIGESINETKGHSRGEDIWLTMDFSEKAIGFNHFWIYFTARMYWGGPQQDVDKLFEEYCRLFYGPAAEPMQVFFRYCEQNWREMEQDLDRADQALALFNVAKTKARQARHPKTNGQDEPSLYERRIDLIDQYLEGLRRKRAQLVQKRGPVPTLRMLGTNANPPLIDGKLDDPVWQTSPVCATGSLRELQTGQQPTCATRFKAAWIGNDLYFAIRCDETATVPAELLTTLGNNIARPDNELNIATRENEDQAIWYGDVVEILLDTDAHSYYQIAINPAGAMIDLDRGAGRSHWFDWSSQAQVATQIADDHWTLEIRIPVTDDPNDPLHQVVGRKPTQSLPWHINICRQRIREQGSEYSAFSPTGTSGFHHPMKFAYCYLGRSHQFPADPSVTDYVLTRRQAEKYLRQRDWKSAQQVLLALAQQDGVTEKQQSDALSLAARLAIRLHDDDRAKELIAQIPIDSVRQTAEMEHLLSRRSYQQIAEQFGDIRWATWPFWQIGQGAWIRGQAHAALGNGPEAESDFQWALAYLSKAGTRRSLLTAMGNNRETHLHDEKAALDAYRMNFEGKSSIGSAEEFRSVLKAASILKRQNKIDEALRTLRVVDLEKLKGYWRFEFLMATGETLAAAGQKQKAIDVFQSLQEDQQAPAALRERAQERMQELSIDSKR